MAEIVNLRQARKARSRREKALKADANRLQFGRSKSEKRQTQDQRTRQESHLDGHKLPGAEKSPADKD
ncbi:DUF4169 family protein [Rhodovibrionaceae bacterium A322]